MKGQSGSRERFGSGWRQSRSHSTLRSSLSGPRFLRTMFGSLLLIRSVCAAEILALGSERHPLGGVEGIHRVARQELNELADGSRRDFFVRHYGKGDGLGTSECAYSMQPTAWKGRDGRLWFATIDGVSMMNPKDLPFNPRPP